MEQMPEIEDFYKRKRHSNKKKGIGNKGDVLELGKVCSLPGMYLSSSDSVASPSSGTKNPLPQTWDSKWHLETPELKERISHKNMQPSHDNSRYVDKFIKNRSAVGAVQPGYSDDYDMFPPLSRQIKMLKAEKNPVMANQLEAKKASRNEEHEDSAERRTQQQGNMENFGISSQENKSEWKTSSFWSVRREKVFPVQANDRREKIASFHENSETGVQLESNTQTKGVNEYVKTSNINALMGELRLSSGQKRNEQDSSRDSTVTDEQNLMLSSDKLSSGHFSYRDKSHKKAAADQNTHLSTENNVDTYPVSKDLEGKLSHSGNSCQEADSSYHCNLPESNLDKDDASGGSYLTQALDDSNEETLFCSSKNQIMSYLKMLLENQELQSSPDDSTEPKYLPSPEFPTTDESQSKSDTEDEGVILRTEEKLSHEDNLFCEEMLNNYIVISNLPVGISKEEILYHMDKVGTVSYLIMEKNRAHIIFFKAKDAEEAFGLKHVLFGRELVVCRPRCPSCTLHLSGLTSSTPNEDVIKIVSGYGVLLNFYRPIHKLTGAPMGYCFIKVYKQVAENILKQSSLVVNNVRIFVEVSSQSEVKFSPQTYPTQQPSSVVPPFHVQGSSEEYKVMFTNVPKLATYDLIKEHFQEFGRLQKVYVKNRKGFVIFASRDSLEQALSTRHTILGTEVKLNRGSLVP